MMNRNVDKKVEEHIRQLASFTPPKERRCFLYQGQFMTFDEMYNSWIQDMLNEGKISYSQFLLNAKY